jgi:hypothetical protein
MRRRDFIKVFAGSAITWPLGARAQQQTSLRVGAASVQSRSAPIYVAFANRMAELGMKKARILLSNLCKLQTSPDTAPHFKRSPIEV